MHEVINQLCEYLIQNSVKAEPYASGRALKFYVGDKPYKLRVRIRTKYYELSFGDNDTNLIRVSADQDIFVAALKYVQDTTVTINAFVDMLRDR